jgi:hypothetical protein
MCEVFEAARFYRYDRRVMFLRVRLGGLPILQLLVSASLVASGFWLYFDARYNAHNLRAAAVPSPHFKPPAPVYTFPAGGRTIFPRHRLVALYGVPGAPVLGALGQQDLQASIQRVQELARQYQPHIKERVLPTFEIIATVASEFPTKNHDYSQEVNHTMLQQWITAARQAGIYVVLDLQPGRTDFLTQAKQLTPLLEQPNVGLALDPEWRLKPHQVPLVQIGGVSISEVNETANWLAALTHRKNLPQKLLLLHQFRTDMLPNRHQLNTSHSELAYAIQMDGQGTQAQKHDTWQSLLRQPPAQTKFGWKNFYVKDQVMLTPTQTMAIQPQPWYVSYQ